MMRLTDKACINMLLEKYTKATVFTEKRLGMVNMCIQTELRIKVRFMRITLMEEASWYLQMDK
jgi:hypothetical protein